MSVIFGETLKFMQGNGTYLELVVFGDEFYARYENRDGYTVVYDTDLDQYCYAILLDGRFASSGVPITKLPPPGVRRHLKEFANVRNEKFEKRYANMRPPEPIETSNHMRTFGANEGLLPGRRVSEGNVRGLTILVEFADMSSSVTAEDVDAMLNAENYKQNGNFCSVRDYFRMMSSGKLNYSNRVVGPIKLSHKLNYYKTRLLVPEALDIAVNDLGIDLSEFDSKGEGIVDAINFMYAGRTVYEGDLWPHNFYIDLNYRGIKTHFYMITSLGRHRIDLSIGTFCHENGHQLCRFPDLYDYGTRDGDFEKSRGIGVYCLMGSGNHLGHGRTPSPVCAYLRYLVNWYNQEIILNSIGEYKTNHSDYGTILKYETEKLNEYFLIENRTRLGLDSNLPSNGLAVYHCDVLGSNEWQGGRREQHYQCGLLQSDGHLDLENNRNPGDAGDLFGKVNGVALAHDTTPSSRCWDGTDSGLIIADISAPDEKIQFSIGKEPTLLIVKKDIRADLLIPDNKPEGVSSVITFHKTGKVKAVKVGLDIIHTYIGDLQVELETPTGKRVLLHDKSGGPQDDLRRTYTSESVTMLADLKGELIDGDWKLNIRDLARRDTGRLNWWSLEIEYEDVDQTAIGEAAPGLRIPDADYDGISHAITISESGNVKDIQVNVEISHTFIADLHVELIAPSGHSAILHNQTGWNKHDLKMTYDTSLAPALETLVGQQIKGDWVLRVRDLQRRDTGVLEKWSVRIAYKNPS